MFESVDGKTWYLKATGEPVFTVWEAEKKFHNNKTKLYWFAWHIYQIDLHGVHMATPRYPIRIYYYNDHTVEFFYLTNAGNLVDSMKCIYETYARRGFWKNWTPTFSENGVDILHTFE